MLKEDEIVSEAINKLMPIVESLDNLLKELGTIEPSYRVHAHSQGQGFGFSYQDRPTKEGLDKLMISGKLAPLLKKGVEIVDHFQGLYFVCLREEFYSIYKKRI